LGDPRFYGHTVGAHELKPALHGSGHPLQNTEALVAVRLSGGDMRFFSDHPLPFDDVIFAAVVADIPMSADELNRFVAVIDYFDVIDKHVLGHHRGRFLLEVHGHGLHNDVGGDVEIVHNEI